MFLDLEVQPVGLFSGLCDWVSIWGESGDTEALAVIGDCVIAIRFRARFCFYCIDSLWPDEDVVDVAVWKWDVVEDFEAKHIGSVRLSCFNPLPLSVAEATAHFDLTHP